MAIKNFEQWSPGLRYIQSLLYSTFCTTLHSLAAQTCFMRASASSLSRSASYFPSRASRTSASVLPSSEQSGEKTTTTTLSSVPVFLWLTSLDWRADKPSSSWKENVFVKHICPQRQKSTMKAKSPSPTFCVNSYDDSEPSDEVTVLIW